MNENNLTEKVNTFLKGGWKVLLGIFITLLVEFSLLSGKNILTNFFNINTYINIGKDVNSSPNMYAAITIIGFFSSIIYISGTYGLIKKNKIIFATIDALVFFFMIFVVANTMIRTNSITKANSLYRNIEIIHPYVSETKYIKLKSDLYQIDSKKRFDNLDKDIRKIAKENNSDIH